jgi:lysophospholipase L1-like esterase
MKAMNGCVGLLGKRTRLAGCTVAMLVLGGLAFAVPAGATEPPPVKTYVALGDSLAFGYKLVPFTEDFGPPPPATPHPNEVPAYFEEGYVNFYLAKLRLTKEVEGSPVENKGLVAVNNGCPGETAGGLTGKVRANRKGETEAVCKYGTQLPLHNEFGAPAHSQLEDAINILTTENGVTHVTPAHPVEVISLNIGGNDELEGVKLCKEEIATEYTEIAKHEKTESKYGGSTPEESFQLCLLSNIGETRDKIKQNIEYAGGALRAFGYTGPIVVLNGYNPDAVIIPHSNGLIQLLNASAIEAATATFGGKYINVFTTVNKYASREGHTKTAKEEEERELKEQESICKYTEMCNPVAVAIEEAKTGEPSKEVGGKKVSGDIHPSKLGAQVIAALMYKVVKA